MQIMFTVCNINSIWQMLATLNSICRYQVLKKHTEVKKTTEKYLLNNFTMIMTLSGVKILFGDLMIYK